MPMRAFTPRGSLATSMPATMALPESMVRMPSIISRVVVLPAPFGPRMPNTSPLGDLEADAVDRLQGPVCLAQVARDETGRTRIGAGRRAQRCRDGRPGRPMLADRLSDRYSSNGLVGDRRPAKRSAARARPARPIRSRRDASAIRRLTAVARSASKRAGSTGVIGSSARSATGTSSPVSPSTTTSGMPPTALATTGRSQAMASRLMIPNGS